MTTATALHYGCPALDRIRAVTAEGNPTCEALTEALALASSARSELDRMEAALIGALRDEGLNWVDVGSILGVTAQGAQQRAARLGVPGTTKGGAT